MIVENNNVNLKIKNCQIIVEGNNVNTNVNIRKIKTMQSQNLNDSLKVF